MKRIALFATALVAMIGFNHSASAQFSTETNSLFYHSIRTPLSNQENPALFPSATTFYITLPRVGASFSSPLAIQDMLTHNPGDTVTYIDFNKISDQLNKNSTFRLGADIDVLGFGFKAGNNYINASVKLKNNMSLSIPIDAINFLTQGNIDENGNTITTINILDGKLFDFSSYLESSVGYSRIFPELDLTIGARLKYLNGVASVSTNQTHIDLNTAAGMDSMTVQAYYQARISSPAVYGLKNPTDTTETFYLPTDISDIIKGMTKSSGIALDLGARYKIGPIAISASLLDLGPGIHWSQNVYQVAPKSGTATSFSFSGLNFTQSGLLQNGNFNLDTLTNYFSSKIDSLMPEFTPGEAYWHSIPTKMNLGASISFLRICRAGFLFHGQFDRGILASKKAIDYENQNFRCNATLSASVNLKNWIELTVANGFVNDTKKFSILNPGIGLILSPGTCVQIYLAADYISSIYLVEARSFNVMAGLNLIFGNAKKLL